MKKYNRFDHHMILLGIIIPFLVFFISMNATFAYFTATAAKNEASSETAVLKISFSADTAGEVVSSSSTDTTKILPGDTLSVTGDVINSGSVDCYTVLEYEVKITKENSYSTETVTKEYYTYTASGWGPVTGVENNYSQTPVAIPHTDGEDTKSIQLSSPFPASTYDNSYQNASVKYKLTANAIQTSSLTATEALNILMDNAGYTSTKIYGKSIQNGTPSVANPVEIQSVGDRTKNLVDTQNFLVYHNNPYAPAYSWERTEGGFKATFLSDVPNGTWSKHGFRLGTVEKFAGKTITVSFDEYIGNSERPALYVAATDVEGESADSFENVSNYATGYIGANGLMNTILENYNNSSNTKQLTCTIPSDLTQKYIIVVFALGPQTPIAAGDTVEYKNIQVEVGDTATAYEPYGKYKIPVNIQGKNLFNINGEYADAVNCTYSIDESTLKLQPTADKITRLTKAVSVIPHTDYVLSGTLELFNIEGYNGVFGFHIFSGPTGGTRLNSAKNLNIQTGEQILNVTFNSAEYSTIYIWFYHNQVNNGTELNGDSYTLYKNIQVEKGSTATEYTPYIGEKNIYLNEPLRGIGNAVDYIDLETGEVVRNVRSLKLKVSDMNNGEDYPGWRKVDYIGDDLGWNQDLSIRNMANNLYLSNISKTASFRLNSKSNSADIYTMPSTFGLTQSQWIAQHPNLVVEICYALTTPYTQKIDTYGIDFDKGYSIQSSDTSVSHIPSEYQQVEYIQSSGQDYIDTGYIPNDLTNVKYDFEFVSGNAGTWIPILGQRKPTSPITQAFAFWVHSSSALLAINYNGSDSSGITGTSCFQRNVYSNIANKFYINGTLVKEFTAGTFEGVSSMIIFGNHNENVVDTRNCSGKIYSLKIYENNTLVRNFVPCYRVSDNKIGLYDTITKQFFTNGAQTDNFTKGANV